MKWLFRTPLYFAADDGAGSGGDGNSGGDAAASGDASSASASAPGTADSAPTTPEPPAAPAPDFTSIRDALKPYGLDNLGDDDQAALTRLVASHQAAEQFKQFQPMLQQVLPQWDKVQAYLAEQDKAAKAKETDWWKAPQYDPSWQSLIQRDPNTGELKGAPGAPPDIVQKYAAWQQHQLGFLNKLSADPIATLRPGLEQVAKQVAEQYFKEQMGGYQEQIAARQFIDANSQWLHARDAAGQVIVDPLTQRPALSEWGKKFAGYVQQAQTMGITAQQAQQEFALALVQRDAAVANQQSTPDAATAKRNQANENFLEKNKNRTSAKPNGDTVARDSAGRFARGLQSVLKDEFTKGGFNMSEPIEKR